MCSSGVFALSGVLTSARGPTLKIGKQTHFSINWQHSASLSGLRGSSWENYFFHIFSKMIELLG